MSYYEDVYLKRLNRYGNDYQSRIQGQRQRAFEDMLNKSVYRVDFEYNTILEPGILTKKDQSESEVLQYLLTRVKLDIPGGTILRIPNKNYLYGQELDETNSSLWMICYLEDLKASGYNRYTVLKMTHHITWKNRNGEECSAWGHFFGQTDNDLTDIYRARSRSGVVYNEPTKVSHFVTPTNANIRKEDYFTITFADHSDTEMVEAYRVTGMDTQSTKGVEYVTVDPVYERDLTAPPEKPEDPTPEEEQEFFWFQGGPNE